MPYQRWESKDVKWLLNGEKNPSRYTVQRMELFNSRRGEFCPMFYGQDNDLLYFTSSREAAIGDKKSAITGFKNNDFLWSKKTKKANGKTPKPSTTG